MMDSDYLKNHLGQCLADCLTEVSEKRPLDPIEYIAQWLYKHIDNVKAAQQQASDAVTLEREAEEFAKEVERQEIMKEEKQRLKAEEAQKQKELEAQATTGLPTLAEGEEPQEPPRIEVSVQEASPREGEEDTSPREQTEEGEEEEGATSAEQQEDGEEVQAEQSSEPPHAEDSEAQEAGDTTDQAEAE